MNADSLYSPPLKRTADLLPCAILVAVYAVCILLVNPRGEFPLNDDWSYTRSAFLFGTHNRIAVDEFSAPNLVGQALYGGLLVKLFGRSFLVLRLSTLILSCAVACMLWMSIRLSGGSGGLAWIAVLSWVFNPIQFWLSFTFMTEIPFLFLICVAALAFFRYTLTQKTWPLVLCGAALGYASLIRQTSAVFLAAAGLCLLVEEADRRQKARRLAAWASAAGVFIAAYYLLVSSRGSATPAAQRKFELLRHLTTEQIIGNLFGSLYYLSFFLLPLITWLVPAFRQRLSGSGAGKWGRILLGWILFSHTGLLWFEAHYSRGPYLPARPFHSQMPFLLNILYDTGLGPVTLDPTYYGPPVMPVHPYIWFAVTLFVTVGLAGLGLFCTWGFDALRPLARRSGRNLMSLFCAASLLFSVLFEVVFSHLQEGGLFDRHILTPALPLVLLLGLFASRGRHSPEDARAPRGRLAFTAAAGLMISVLAWFSVTATHDYLAWNRLRWELGGELLSQKVDPLSISGGFEFNGWHNYDTFRARGHIEKVYYWWYDREDYLITMEPQENYHIQKKVEYYSWLHLKKLPLYLLRKE